MGEVKSENYKFFQNRKCEFFPCHQTEDEGNFNCLFCYCPLYALGTDCGGNYQMMDNGVKDCSACMVPHRKENYSLIADKFSQIIELFGKQREEDK